MDIADSSELGMLIDMGVCMAVFAMAKACTPEEVEGFFVQQKERLKEQGFKDEVIDKIFHKVHKAIWTLQRGVK